MATTKKELLEYHRERTALLVQMHLRSPEEKEDLKNIVRAMGINEITVFMRLHMYPVLRRMMNDLAASHGVVLTYDPKNPDRASVPKRFGRGCLAPNKGKTKQADGTYR